MVEFFILLLIELFTRLIIYIKRGQLFLFLRRYYIQIKKLHINTPYNNYIKTPNIKNPKFPSNEYGFVGEKNYNKFKNKNIHRIITTGGSTVEQNDLDMQMPFDKNLTWPSLLEKN